MSQRPERNADVSPEVWLAAVREAIRTGAVSNGHHGRRSHRDEATNFTRSANTFVRTNGAAEQLREVHPGLDDGDVETHLKAFTSKVRRLVVCAYEAQAAQVIDTGLVDSPTEFSMAIVDRLWRDWLALSKEFQFESSYVSRLPVLYMNVDQYTDFARQMPELSVDDRKYVITSSPQDPLRGAELFLESVATVEELFPEFAGDRAHQFVREHPRDAIREITEAFDSIPPLRRNDAQLRTMAFDEGPEAVETELNRISGGEASVVPEELAGAIEKLIESRSPRTPVNPPQQQVDKQVGKDTLGPTTLA